MSSALAPAGYADPFRAPVYSYQPPHWSVFDMLFSFDGRINRAKWWLAVLISGVLSFAFQVLAHFVALISSFGGSRAVVGIVGIMFFSGYLAMWIVTFWLGLATGIKRLHDTGRSGHWLWVFVCVPYVALATGLALSISGWVAAADKLGPLGDKPNPADVLAIVGPALIPLLVGWLVAFAIWIWSIVWLGCLRGTRGANAYGADPIPHVA